MHSQAICNLTLFLIDALCISVPVARPCLLRPHRGYSCGDVTNLSRLIIYTDSPENSCSLHICFVSLPLTDHRSPSRVRTKSSFALSRLNVPSSSFFSMIKYYVNFVKKLFTIYECQSFVRVYTYILLYDSSPLVPTVVFLAFEFFLWIIKRM